MDGSTFALKMLQKNYVENKNAFVLFITRDEQVDLGDAQS